MEISDAFLKWYFKKIYSYADTCIAISPMVEKAITDLGAKTTISWNNPIPVEKWKRTIERREKRREMPGHKESDFCILGVCQIENRKGCEDFVKIAKMISDAQFRWIGGRPLKYLLKGSVN